MARQKMTLENGGPAFPQPFVDDATEKGHGGMSLRDYFAAKVIQTLLAKRTPPEVNMSQPKTAIAEYQSWVEQLAYDAYRLADVMVNERDALEDFEASEREKMS